MSIGANLKPDENGNWGAVGIKNSSTGNELYVNADGSINVSGGGGGGGGAIISNASSGVATTSTNQATVAYNYGYNGASWDQLQVDANKNLKVLTSQGAVDSTALKQLTFQTAATALGAVTVDISGYNTVSLDVVITGTATVQFNVSNDGTNFTLIQYQTPQNTTASSTSVGNTTTRGLRFNVSGYKYFQSNISSYTTGSVTVSGFASTGTTSQSLYTLSTTGGLIVTPRLAAGTDQASMSQMSDGQTTVNGLTATGSMGFTGSAYDKVRVGKIYKYIEFLNLTSGSNATIWTPTASKKFRLMGIAVSTALTAGTFKVLDNTTEFYTFSTAVTNGYGTFDFGNGYLSSAANNVLYIKNNNASTAHIWVTAWGTEE